jgi:hypothetical protein
VRRRPASGEQARFSQEEGAGAYGGKAPCLGRLPPEKAKQRRVRKVTLDADPAGDEQRVDPAADLAQSAVGVQAEPAGCGEETPPEPQDLHSVGVVAPLAHLPQPARSAREDFEGPGDIEDLDVGERHHRDAPGTRPHCTVARQRTTCRRRACKTTTAIERFLP